MRDSTLLLAACALVCAALSTVALASASPLSSIRNDSHALCFPDGFLLGSATASYQVEGGVKDGNRTSSIWDDFCRSHDKLECANVADDFYHRFAADIRMLKDAGHSMFRFSISWSRVMTWDSETEHMVPNPPGIAFYHAVIDDLNSFGITPVLTMYHWDLPSALETQLSLPGWIDPAIQEHFVEYATLLYQEYGRKVSFWTTFNEPWTFSYLGYSGNMSGGAHAPGLNDSNVNQYTVAHHVLLSHAKAVQKFRELKTAHIVRADARISIVIVGDHSMPLNPKRAADVAAAMRVSEFYMGWFLQPIVSGDYPAVMRERAGERLPHFLPEEEELVKNSYDLFLLNHYSTHLVTDCDSPDSKTPCDQLPLGWARDMGVDNSQKPKGSRNSSSDAQGKQLCSYFSAYPEGYRHVIQWIHEHNETADILLTENGYCGNDEIDNQDQLWYHQTYLEQVHKAITEDKIPVIGYTAWSLMDNYEWGSFKPRFGLYYVNFTSQVGSKDVWSPKPTDLARIPRTAAKWFASVAQTGCMLPWKKGEFVGEIVPVGMAPPVSKLHGWRTFWIIAFVVLLVPAACFAVGIVRRRRQDADATASEQSPLLL